MSSTILQIVLFLQFFIMGVLVTVAVRHAYIHFRPAKHEPEPPQPLPVDEHLPPAVKEKLLHTSQAKFQDVLNHSASQLQNDLQVTTGHINNLVMRLASEIVSGELERYRSDLSKLHKQADVSVGGIRTEIAKHQEELEAKIAKEIEAEKERLIKQIDTKLADAVGSFLLETLQHNVDIGSQSSYLIEMLEEHKADFIKEVVGDEKGSS